MRGFETPSKFFMVVFFPGGGGGGELVFFWSVFTMPLLFWVFSPFFKGHSRVFSWVPFPGFLQSQSQSLGLETLSHLEK